MGTSVERSSASKDLFVRGEPYGISGEQVDGMAVSTVLLQAGKKAVAHCRARKAPISLKC